MGTWGTAILSDDTVADVVGFITDRLKAGEPLANAIAAAKVEFAELEDDTDEGPLLWLAIAHAQSKWGTVDDDVLLRLRHDIETGRGLDRWRGDGKALSRRQAALAAFLKRIETPNPKPSALPKLVVREAPFRAGDCLSVALPDGHYGAALVLAEDNSNREIGVNLIATLDYYEPVPPDLAVFERRPWLFHVRISGRSERYACWYVPVKFKAVRSTLTVIGNVPLKRSDPATDGNYPYAGWLGFGERVLLIRAQLAANPPESFVGRLASWIRWPRKS